MGAHHKSLVSEALLFKRNGSMAAEWLSMITIPGKIIRGLGAASETLKLQMPHFVRDHPELGNCSQRTINVILESQLEIISPTFLIGPLRWHPNALIEMFGFLSVVFDVPELKLETEAWIYLPYNSPHRANPFYVEILAPELQLGGTATCNIRVSARKVIA